MKIPFKTQIIRRMMASHLAGPRAEDAEIIARQAARLGWSSAFGYWNRPDDTPSDAADVYRRTLTCLEAADYPAYLSIKVTAIGFDPSILHELLDQAAARNIRIHIDAMDPSSAPKTFAMIERALATHANIGCTLPARWRRSRDDARRLVDFSVPVRVVKGQWGDSGAAQIDPRTAYRNLVADLAGAKAPVAIATHDRELARDALRILSSTQTPCEIEQMSSLPQNCASVAREFGAPFRVYIPFGWPSLPYDPWQARTRPQILLWALRDTFRSRHGALLPA